MLNCKIISTKKTDVYENLESVVLMTPSGEVQILPEHAEYFSLLVKGVIYLKKQNKTEELEIDEGVCYFSDDNLSIII